MVELTFDNELGKLPDADFSVCGANSSRKL